MREQVTNGGRPSSPDLIGLLGDLDVVVEDADERGGEPVEVPLVPVEPVEATLPPAPYPPGGGVDIR
jgi:hypothetical protein